MGGRAVQSLTRIERCQLLRYPESASWWLWCSRKRGRKISLKGFADIEFPVEAVCTPVREITPKSFCHLCCCSERRFAGLRSGRDHSFKN